MPTVATPTALSANTPTSLGTITPQSGQMTSVTIDRTVSPNAISAPTLNGLSASATLQVVISATKDGTNFFQKTAATFDGGTLTDSSDNTITSCGLSVSMAAGEVQHKITATPSTACGLSATLATASAVTAQ